MQPSNSFRLYETIVMILVALNVGITAVATSAPTVGFVLSPGLQLALIVASAVIPTILNRMDAFGAPQGNQVLLNVQAQPNVTVTEDQPLPPVVNQGDVVIPPGTPRVDGRSQVVASSKFTGEF